MKRSIVFIGIGLLAFAPTARPQSTLGEPPAANQTLGELQVSGAAAPTVSENAPKIRREALKIVKDKNHLIYTLTAVSPENPQAELLNKWKATTDELKRGKIKLELREVLKAQFHVRMHEQEQEIAELEAKVKKLRDQLELRRSKQEEIIDFRMQQLFREAEGLGWGAEEEPSFSSRPWTSFGAESSPFYTNPPAGASSGPGGRSTSSSATPAPPTAGYVTPMGAGGFAAPPPSPAANSASPSPTTSSPSPSATTPPPSAISEPATR